MHDQLTFETRLADAYERYLVGAPVTVDARAMAAGAAAVTRGAPRLREVSTPRSARLLALAAVLILGLVVVGAAAVGRLLPVQPAPTSTPQPSTGADAITNGPIAMVIPVDGAAEFQLIYPDGNGTAVTLPIVGGTASCPTFSPDGRSLAYVGYGEVSGNMGLNPRDLVIARADGTELRSVQESSFDSQSFRQIVWSADSGVVVVTKAEFVGPNGEGGLLVARRDDDHATVQFTSAGEFPGEISLSPDGTELAFVDPAGGDVSTKIVVVSTAIDQPGRTIATAGQIRAIAWSPDGRWIAYVAATGVDANDADVYLVSPDGSEPRPLDVGSPGNESHLAWSPDGRLLAVANETGYLQLFDAAGTKVKSINVPDGQLTWAPDSRSLLVAVRETLSNRRALRVDISTGIVSPIAAANGFYAQCPVSWSLLP